MMAELSRSPFPPAWFAVGPLEPSRFRGCRVHHDAASGTASFRFHPGRADATDRFTDPIHFLLTASELDELIEHLSSIRASLVVKGTST